MIQHDVTVGTKIIIWHLRNNKENLFKYIKLACGSKNAKVRKDLINSLFKSAYESTHYIYENNGCDIIMYATVNKNTKIIDNKCAFCNNQLMHNIFNFEMKYTYSIDKLITINEKCFPYFIQTLKLLGLLEKYFILCVGYLDEYSPLYKLHIIKSFTHNYFENLIYKFFN